MKNEKQLMPILKELHYKILSNDIIEVRGSKIVEAKSQIIELNPKQSILHFNGKSTNEEYVKKELEWYLSKNRNINGYVDDVKIWQQTADKDGIVNSNYGWCILSEENGNQFINVQQELRNDKNSRRASMIYTRPSIWKDYNENGRNDFICTYVVQYRIRDNKLMADVLMRSQDAIFGFLNDFAWQCFVYEKLINGLKPFYNLEYGIINWHAVSFHLYERHFKLLEQIIKTKVD